MSNKENYKVNNILSNHIWPTQIYKRLLLTMVQYTNRHKMFHFVLILLIKFVISSENETIISTMVKDFVEYLGKYVIVNAYLCNRKGPYLLIHKTIDFPGIISVQNYISSQRDSANLLKVLSTNFHQVSANPKYNYSINYQAPSNDILFVGHFMCIEELLVLADNHKLFANPFKWLLFYNNDNDVINNFFNLNILTDSDITLAKSIENTTFNLIKIYKYRKYGSIMKEKMGYWQKDEGLQIRDFEKISARRRKDFMGTILKSSIVITNNDSMNHLTDKRYKHIDSIAKVNYVLVEHLGDIVNATLTYSVQATWGYENNSEWSGMIGELTRHEADIGGTALFLTADRIAIIDYISMTTPTRSKFVFREPKLSYVTNVFTLPFDRSVWISTIALLTITSLALYLIMKWEWHSIYIRSSEDEAKDFGLRDSFGDISILAFGAFCQQGTSSIPSSYPGRITTIFLFISLMFLYTSYSANIVALLQSSSSSIQTLQDLLKSRIDVGVDNTVFNHFYFTNATEPTRRAIYLQKVAPPGQIPKFLSIDEGVRRMRNGLFAFHMETGPGYKIVSETFHEAEKCGLQEIQYLQVPDPWLAIQKNSSFKEPLKIGLRLIQESGLQAREVSLIYTKRPVCVNRGSSFISVGLVDCYPAAVVLAGGIIIAITIFLFENYVHYRLGKRRKHDKNISSIASVKILQR